MADSILLNNKLLKAAEQKVESGLTPENQKDYMKIVVAGLRVVLDKGPNGILATLKQSRDPVHDAAVGAVNLVLLLRKQSRDTMPIKALVPAAMTLMLQALDFAEKANITKITPQKLDRATLIFRNQVFGAFRITPDVLKKAAMQTHGVMRDPAKMDMIARYIGAAKHPEAAAPGGAPPQGGKSGV